MDNLVLSGKPGVIIKCGSDFMVGGTHFMKGQMVACITDSDVDFYYTKIDKMPTKGASTILYGEDLSLSEIVIRSVPFNKMMSKIVFGEQNGTIKKPTVVNKTADEDGYIALDGNKISDIQVLDLYYNPVSFTVKEGNIIQVAPHSNCKIYYNIELSNGILMNGNPNNPPYFEIECVANGNSIGETRHPITQIISIKRAALVVDPLFRFNNSIDNFDLRFHIIRDKSNEIRYGR